MIAYVAILIGLFYVLKSWRLNEDARLEKDYLRIRYQTFRLREELVKMYINKIVDIDKCEILYNSINWAVRYIREMPFFLIKGFNESLKSANISIENSEFEEELKNAHPDLKKWYSDFSGVLFEAVELFSPAGLFRKFRQPYILHFLYFRFLFIIWFIICFYRFESHPLHRLRFSFASRPIEYKEIQEIEKTRNELKNLAEKMREIIADNMKDSELCPSYS